MGTPHQSEAARRVQPVLDRIVLTEMRAADLYRAFQRLAYMKAHRYAPASLDDATRPVVEQAAALYAQVKHADRQTYTEVMARFEDYTDMLAPAQELLENATAAYDALVALVAEHAVALATRPIPTPGEH